MKNLISRLSQGLFLVPLVLCSCVPNLKEVCRYTKDVLVKTATGDFGEGCPDPRGGSGLLDNLPINKSKEDYPKEKY